MKVTFTTRMSYAREKVSRHGVQFDCQITEYANEPGDAYAALNRILEVFREECRDSGWYLNIHPRRYLKSSQGGAGESGVKDPKIAMLQARLNSALQLAENYKKTIEELKKKMYGV